VINANLLEFQRRPLILSDK